MATDTKFLSSLKPKDGQTIDLERGKTYECTNAAGVIVQASGVHIRAVGTGAPPKIKFHGKDWAGVFNIPREEKDITIEGLVFSDLGSMNLGIMPSCANLTLRKLGVEKGGGLAIFHGVRKALVEDCYADNMVDRNFVYLGADQTGGKFVSNTDVTFRRVRCNGSKYEHGIRVHAGNNISFYQCILNNVASPQGKQALNLRDGVNHLVQDCKIAGKSVLGPLGDKNGGLYDPAGAERDRKLALRLKGLKIVGSTFTNWIILEAGLEGLDMQDTCVKATEDGFVFLIEKEYGPRKLAAGSMKNVKTNYIGSGAFSKGSSFSKTGITKTNVTFNGSPV